MVEPEPEFESFSGTGHRLGEPGPEPGPETERAAAKNFKKKTKKKKSKLHKSKKRKSKKRKTRRRRS